MNCVQCHGTGQLTLNEGDYNEHEECCLRCDGSGRESYPSVERQNARFKVLQFDKDVDGTGYLIPWNGGQIQFILTEEGELFARKLPFDGPISGWEKIPLLEILEEVDNGTVK